MKITLVSLSAALVSLSTASAFALQSTGDEAVDAFLGKVETEAEMTITYSDVSSGGGTTELSGVVFDFSGDAPDMKIPALEFAGGQVDGDGNISFESLKFAGAVMEDDEGRLTIGSATGTGLRFRAAPEGASDEQRAVYMAPLYNTFEITDVSLNIKEPETVDISIDSLRGAATKYLDDIVLEGNLAIEGIRVPADSLPDKEAQDALAAMELSEVVVDINAAGTFDPDAETVSLHPVQLNVEQMGALELNLKIGGITLDLVKQSQTAVTEAELEAVGMRFLQGSLVSAALKIDDASMTGKLLSFAAKEMGGSPDDLIAQAEFLIPTMLSEVGNLEFQTKVAKEVGTFLREPSNIELTLAPQSALPFGALMAGAQNPGQLIQMLNVDISANQ